MAGYDYAKFVGDFGKRTLENNEIINDLRSQDISDKKKSEIEIENKHHEVTQLINSLFGMIIVPYEKYKFDTSDQDGSNSIGENDLKKTQEYYKIAKIIINLEKRGELYNSYKDRYLVSGFIKHLRNALAHSGDDGMHFTPVEKKRVIKSIIFYDNDGAKEFCVELSIGRIRALMNLIYSMYEKIENMKEHDDLTAYKAVVESKRNLMKSNMTWARQFEKDILRNGRSKELL